MGLTFRKLRADEIECRIQSVKAKGLILLLYKDARCDMNILDETLGVENWQRKHEVVNGNLFCSVGVYRADTSEWVWKQDVGTESNTERQKGEASDSFKRACFNLGIGRELYTAPFIFIKKADCNITSDGKCYDKFRVEHIAYDKNGKITELSIVNETSGVVVFKQGKTGSKARKSANNMPKAIDLSGELATNIQKKTYIELCKELGVDNVEILKKTGWTSGAMTAEQHARAMLILKEIEDSRQ